MSTVVPRSQTDEAPSDNGPPKSIIVTKLLSRPQTAVASLSSPHQKNQSVLSSIEVIGQDKNGTDIKNRIKSAFSGQSSNRRFKQQQSSDLSHFSSGRPHRIQSAQSSVNLRGNNGDITRIKEAILQKGYSSPNLGQSSDVKSSVVDNKKEDINQSHSTLRKAFRDSKKTSLTIKSASVVLITRPSSSASIAKRFSQVRPKTTAAAVSQEFQKKDLENGRASDEPQETLCDSGEKGTIRTVQPSPDLSGVPASTGVDKFATSSNKSHTRISKEAEAKTTKSINAPGLDVVKGSSHEGGESKDNETKVSSPCPENVVKPSGALSKAPADQSGSGVKRSNELALNLKSENVNVGDLSSPKSVETGNLTFRRSQLSPPRQVTSPERELAPILCSPSTLKQTPVSLLNSKAPDAEKVLTRHIGSEEIGDLNSDTRLHILELLSYDKTEPIQDTSNASNSPSPNFVGSSRIYKMAKVEMYEKSTVKQTRFSILDEIKKQNMLLEERNSESRLENERSKKPKPAVPSETNREMNNESSTFAEKGNVCGSPGFKFLSEQLRSMNDQAGSHVNTRKSHSRAVRDPQGDGTPKKSDKEGKSSGPRPLSDYILNSSPDNLRVTGGACTYKSGQRAVSSAVGNIATQAGIVSKVSLQGTATKCDNADYTVSDVGNLHSKVHVSLSYLKEKNKVNSSGVAFRHRLDGYVDQSPNDHSSSHPKHKTPILSAISANEVDPNHDLDICNDSNNENTDSEKVENDKELYSASSTPTATFSGSELLYPNDGVHRSHGEELSASDMPGYERERQKLRDLEIGNRRPTSKSKRTSYSVVDKVSFDRERDDLRALNNSLPAKAPVLRNPVHRNSLVRGEPMISNRPLGPNSNRDSEDLVAMGTIWSPANNNNNSSNIGGGGSSTAPTRSSSNTTGSNKSIPLNNNNNISNSNSIPQRKPVTVSMSTSARLGHCNGTFGGGGKNTNRENVKEVDPKYSDPLIGAPASFQQRLMDLASLEAETIRWERTKRVKKKPKDRDS